MSLLSFGAVRRLTSLPLILIFPILYFPQAAGVLNCRDDPVCSRVTTCPLGSIVRAQKDEGICCDQCVERESPLPIIVSSVYFAVVCIVLGVFIL